MHIVDKLAYTLSLILHDDIDKIKSCIEFPRNKDNGDITFNTMKYFALVSRPATNRDQGNWNENAGSNPV